MSLNLDTSLRLKRTVNELLKGYRDTYQLKSLEVAIIDAVNMAMQYRALAQACKEYELTKGVKD